MINWTNVTDLADIPALANQASQYNIFWSGMLYMGWIVLLFLLSVFGWEVALLSSAFVALVLGVLLLYADLVSIVNILVFAGIILFMVIYLIWRNER